MTENTASDAADDMSGGPASTAEDNFRIGYSASDRAEQLAQFYQEARHPADAPTKQTCELPAVLPTVRLSIIKRNMR